MELSDVRIGALYIVSNDIANKNWGNALVEVADIRGGLREIKLKKVASGEYGTISFGSVHLLLPSGRVR